MPTTSSADTMLDEHHQDGVAWLTLDRPDQLNALTVDSYRAVRGALERLGTDDTTRVVVLTGRGRAFCAGADKSLLVPLTDADREAAGAEFTRFIETLASFEKPLFGAVNGLAVGVGCTLLLYCDVVLMAASARLRMPFTALGLVPEAGSSVLLAERVRWAEAMWAVLSSEWISSEAAVDIGLALRVVPDEELIAQTRAMTATIASLHAGAVVETKRVMTAGRLDRIRGAMARELEGMRAARR